MILFFLVDSFASLRRKHLSALWESAVPAILILLVFPAWSKSGQITLFEKETPYQYLKVVEDSDKGTRSLCNKTCDFIQGAIILSRHEALMIDYMRSAMAGLAFLDTAPQRMLFIGMGIGAMPRYLMPRYPDARIDIVEIDPDVPSVARRFFHFSETSKIRISIDDGALFVKKSRRKYDVIFLDACFGPDIPEQLASKDFFDQTRKRLSEKGVVVANLASPVLNPGFGKMVLAFCAVFPLVEILSTDNPANVIVVAGTRPLADREKVAQRAKTITAGRHFDFDLEPLARQRFLYDPCPQSP